MDLTLYDITELCLALRLGWGCYLPGRGWKQLQWGGKRSWETVATEKKRELRQNLGHVYLWWPQNDFCNQDVVMMNLWPLLTFQAIWNEIWIEMKWNVKKYMLIMCPPFRKKVYHCRMCAFSRMKIQSQTMLRVARRNGGMQKWRIYNCCSYFNYCRVV